MSRFAQRLAISLTAAGLTVAALAVPAAATGVTWVVDDDRDQCGMAQFTTVAEALSDPLVDDGDVIRVCPGTYSGVGDVTKSVTLRGQPDAVDAEDCFQPPAALDDTVHAIIRPLAGSAPATGIDILVGNVTVIGFVIDGWDIGLQTVDEQSGYRIAHNIVQSNRFGIDIRSSGAFPTRVDHNCLRGNPDETLRPALSVAVGSEPDLVGTTLVGQTLINARIDHNNTFQNREGILFVGRGYRERVLVDHNVMVETAQPLVGGAWSPVAIFPIALGINNSKAVSILDNDVRGPRFGVYALGPNAELEIGRNTIRNGRQGLFGTVNALSFGISFRTPAAGADPTLGAQVYENDISAMSIGIHAQPNALRSSTLANNVTSNNASAIPTAAGDGIRLMTGDTGNFVLGNTANDNSAFGIYAQLATGNLFGANEMLRNGIWDARDDSNPVDNTWQDNNCVTDSPDGLCPGP